MKSTGKRPLRIAVLDLYEGSENQGMRCLREIITEFGRKEEVQLETREFDVRCKCELPDTSWDIYISSGGPGDPLESAGLPWDDLYFKWLHEMEVWNASRSNSGKKYVFFICHSFQLACRYFKLGQLTRRRSTAFGVFPVHLLDAGAAEPIFQDMPDPFYAVDSRDYQVVQPDLERLVQTGSSVLCIEKERPHVPYERAIMGIRFSDYLIGTQFHPEADAAGMKLHLESDGKRKTVIDNYGLRKWESMIAGLNDPEKICWTHDHILPNFLRMAAEAFRESGQLAL